MKGTMEVWMKGEKMKGQLSEKMKGELSIFDLTERNDEMFQPDS